MQGLSIIFWMKIWDFQLSEPFKQNQEIHFTEKSITAEVDSFHPTSMGKHSTTPKTDKFQQQYPLGRNKSAVVVCLKGTALYVSEHCSAAAGRIQVSSYLSGKQHCHRNGQTFRHLVHGLPFECAQAVSCNLEGLRHKRSSCTWN